METQLISLFLSLHTGLRTALAIVPLHPFALGHRIHIFVGLGGGSHCSQWLSFLFFLPRPLLARCEEKEALPPQETSISLCCVLVSSPVVSWRHVLSMLSRRSSPLIRRLFINASLPSPCIFQPPLRHFHSQTATFSGDFIERATCYQRFFPVCFSEIF